MGKLRFIEFKQVVPGHTTSKGMEAGLDLGRILICALSSPCVTLTKSQLPVPVLLPLRRKYRGVGGTGIQRRTPGSESEWPCDLGKLFSFILSPGGVTYQKLVPGRVTVVGLN